MGYEIVGFLILITSCFIFTVLLVFGLIVRKIIFLQFVVSAYTICEVDLRRFYFKE